ncbi:103_t:CDS:2 [Paraglomus occultum]|uniref:103_t:CDS:1 n=1 Tax=Paraglomus occultum TaxID=144539 RepID=A0A9N8WGS2_9GLOM|nr:103_t:CDS:2 [Paraglomus occultum]
MAICAISQMGDLHSNPSRSREGSVDRDENTNYESAIVKWEVRNAGILVQKKFVGIDNATLSMTTRTIFHIGLTDPPTINPATYPKIQALSKREFRNSSKHIFSNIDKQAWDGRFCNDGGD